jgi:hypothetical protein
MRLDLQKKINVDCKRNKEKDERQIKIQEEFNSPQRHRERKEKLLKIH